MVALLKAPGATRRLRAPQLPHGHRRDARHARRRRREHAHVTADKAVIETGPGGGAMVYVPLGGVDHADCQDAYSQGQGRAGPRRSNTACSGNDVVARVPEEARRQRLDGRRRRLRRQHERRRRRCSRRVHHDVGERTARPISCSPTRAPSSRRGASRRRDGAAVRRRRDEAVAAVRSGACAWARSASPTRPTRKNNGMMLASLPPGEWHTGWVRDATYAIVALARIGPLRRGQGRARLLPERRARRRATRAT